MTPRLPSTIRSQTIGRPRLGVVVDPRGNRKSKIYANFGRYNYQMPLDAAIRSLSSELDLTGFALRTGDWC